jgi:hypothetical protein
LAAFAKASGESVPDVETQSADAVAKMFEEIKLMYQELPARVSRRLDPERLEARRRRSSSHPQLMMDIGEYADREIDSPVGILFILSQFKDDFPWLYDFGLEVFRKINSKKEDPQTDILQLLRLADMVMHHPGFRQMSFSSKRRDEEMEHSLRALKHTLERYIR